MLSDRRLGRFSIAVPTFRYRPEEARTILAETIVIRAELAADGATVEYLAHHLAFAPVPLGEDPPAYAPAFAASGGWRWQRLHGPPPPMPHDPPKSAPPKGGFQVETVPGMQGAALIAPAVRPGDPPQVVPITSADPEPPR